MNEDKEFSPVLNLIAMALIFGLGVFLGYVGYVFYKVILLGD